MSHASQQYAFTEPRTVKRAQVKPSEREHQTSSSAPRVSLAPAADRTLDILEFIASNGQTQAATLARELGIPRSTVYQLLEISVPSWQEQTYHHNLSISNFHQDEP